MLRAHCHESVKRLPGARPRDKLTLVPRFFKRRPESQGRHTPTLWPVWFVAPFTLILVGGAAYALYQGADSLLAVNRTGKKQVDVQDVIKLTVTALTLIGAVLAALYAYRKQLLDEGASHRADATQLAERYAKAAEQLGHEQPAVRLAGVYSMARLADDWPEQRQVCIDVLCAYLRMPYEINPAEPGFKYGEREVRLTVIQSIRDRLEDPTSPTTWCGRDLNFNGATFDGGNFYDANFSGLIDFRNTEFLDGAVSFANSDFSRGVVTFGGAEFSGGAVFFVHAKFSGAVTTFLRAKFSGSEVEFNNAVFACSEGTYFSHAQFSGGKIDFSDVSVSRGGTHFDGVEVYSAAAIEWGPFSEIPPTAP